MRAHKLHCVKAAMLAMLTILVFGGATVLASTTPAAPFLVLPFHQGTLIKITEGWIYSDEEHAIHGSTNHFGVDFAVPRGTEVFAPCNGWAVQGFHVKFEGLYRGIRVGNGLGHFVQIWNNEHGRFICCAHLQKVAEQIPMVVVEQRGDAWEPIGIYVSGEQIIKIAKQVRQGDPIGWSGDSGLSWGYGETPTKRPDPDDFPSWDEPHVHMDITTRGPDGRKNRWFDPFGIEGQAPAYQDVMGVSRPGELWLRDPQGHLRFAAK